MTEIPNNIEAVTYMSNVLCHVQTYRHTRVRAHTHTQTHTPLPINLRQMNFCAAKAIEKMENRVEKELSVEDDYHFTGIVNISCSLK